MVHYLFLSEPDQRGDADIVIVVSVLALAISPLLACYGLRFFKVTSYLTGFMVSGTLCFWIYNGVMGNRWNPHMCDTLLICSFVAVLGGCVTIALWRFGVWLLGFGSCMMPFLVGMRQVYPLVTYMAKSWFGWKMLTYQDIFDSGSHPVLHWGILISFALVSTLVATMWTLRKPRSLVIFGSSFMGAFGVAVGISGLDYVIWGRWPPLFRLLNEYSWADKGMHMPLICYYILVACIHIIGVFVQCKWTAKGRTHQERALKLCNRRKRFRTRPMGRSSPYTESPLRRSSGDYRGSGGLRSPLLSYSSAPTPYYEV